MVYCVWELEMNDFGVADSIIREINSPTLLYLFVNPFTNGLFMDKKTSSLMACESKLIAESMMFFYPVLKNCIIEENTFEDVMIFAGGLCNSNITIVDAEVVGRHLAK